jgi:protein-tyrosine phosphatase
LIDIHHHCLPGIDDGPGSVEEALEQCRLAFQNGIQTIIATPHVLRGEWVNDSPQKLRALADGLNERLHGEPLVLLGCEYFFAHDILQRIDSSDAIVRLARSRYLLIEFPSTSVPQMVDDVFYQLQLRRVTPVIAHPERNQVFQGDTRLLTDLVAKGAKTQLTAGSLIGKFGEAARGASRSWLDEELVHFIATDAHNTDRRRPEAAEAIEEITRRWGADRAEALTGANPQAVVDDAELPYDPEPVGPSRRPGLFDSARRFFTGKHSK